MDTKILKQSFWCAAGVFVYIVVIVNVMTGFLPRFEVEHTVFAPIVFLTLFVISAAVTGGLVLGKPHYALPRRTHKRGGYDVFLHAWIFSTFSFSHARGSLGDMVGVVHSVLFRFSKKDYTYSTCGMVEPRRV